MPTLTRDKKARLIELVDAACSWQDALVLTRQPTDLFPANIIALTKAVGAYDRAGNLLKVESDCVDRTEDKLLPHQKRREQRTSF